MVEKILISGNEAIGYGAIYADCTHYFGYPITPQNELIEFMAREFPKLGRTFVQAESEFASISMVCGAAATGVRAMTSTASTAFSLMQEGISGIASMELPCLIVNVQRGGPGAGSTQHSQMDYLIATRGAHGGYKNIVLAPFSVQEAFELTQLAFYLADKYRIHIILLSDGIMGQMYESVELKKLGFPPLPEKNWAVKGSAAHNYVRTFVHNSPGIIGSYYDYMKRSDEKYTKIKENEVRYETYEIEDADIVLVSYGSTARVSLRAMYLARDEGIRVGLFRPITLWPFPREAINKIADNTKKFLVVEDCMGQMIEDVELAVVGKARIGLVGSMDRNLPTGSGMILSRKVLEKIKDFN